MRTGTRGKAPSAGVLLTAVEGAPPAHTAEGSAGSVGVGRGGGDQVVVHMAVEPRLLGRGLLLHLSPQTGFKPAEQPSVSHTCRFTEERRENEQKPKERPKNRSFDLFLGPTRLSTCFYLWSLHAEPASPS